MLYDLDKDIGDEATIALQWHGDDTLVMVKGTEEGKEGRKTPVKKGDVLVVTLSEARMLLKYSNNWTKEGDKPVIHQYQKNIQNLAKKPSTKEEKSEEEGDDLLTPDEVQKLPNRKAVVAEIAKLGESANEKAPREELNDMYAELYAAKDETEDDTEGEGSEEETFEFTVTQEWLDENPEIAGNLKVGDVIDVPVSEEEEEVEEEEEEEEEEETQA